MKTWISVLTCPRRGDYLERTLASLERGGAELVEHKVIHVDGPAALERPGWDVVSVSSGGARDAMVSVMRRAAAAGVELLLYFEDDAVVCRNAIRAMLEIGVPEPLGFVSYCDLRHDGVPLELRAFPGCPREFQVADGGFNGCQALAIPLRTLQRFEDWTPPAWLGPNNCDGVMSCISESFGILDSLANHVGELSAIAGGRYPKVPVVRGWRGEDFDADVVPRRFELNELGKRCALHGNVLHAGGLPCRKQKLR